MGLLDDAKDKLGDAAEWVKDKAEHLGEQTQGAGQALGEKAAEARNWVEGRIGGDSASESGATGRGDGPEGAQPLGEPMTLHGDAAPAGRTSGGGDFASEWVDASADPDMGGPQAEEPAGGEDASLDEPGPQNPL